MTWKNKKQKLLKNHCLLHLNGKLSGHYPLQMHYTDIWLLSNSKSIFQSPHVLWKSKFTTFCKFVSGLGTKLSTQSSQFSEPLNFKTESSKAWNWIYYFLITYIHLAGRKSYKVFIRQKKTSIERIWVL